MGSFPFHTETAYWRVPARYLFLYCVDPGAANRPTLVLDLLGKLSISQKEILSSEPWVVHSIRRPFLCRLIEKVSGGTVFRYDPVCMRPASRKAASQAILERAVLQGESVQIPWRRGALLVVDNHRLLHGRAPAAFADPDRRLQRVLVAEDSV